MRERFLEVFVKATFIKTYDLIFRKRANKHITRLASVFILLVVLQIGDFFVSAARLCKSVCLIKVVSELRVENCWNVFLKLMLT
jgi:hypothetical protein